MKTSEVLEAAAEQMASHGAYPARDKYCEHLGKLGGGRCCIKGAVWLGMHDGKWDNHIPMSNETLPAMAALITATGQDYHSYTVEHTTAECVALLRAVAMTERAREARLLPVIRETVTA